MTGDLILIGRRRDGAYKSVNVRTQKPTSVEETKGIIGQCPVYFAFAIALKQRGEAHL